jgi:Photosystem II reaction centre T protein
MNSGVTTIVYAVILALILGTLFFAIFFREDPNDFLVKKKEEEK